MRRRSPLSSPVASVTQPGMTVSSSPSKPSAAQCPIATSIGTRGIPQVLWESSITVLARRGLNQKQAQVFVDLPLIGVDGAGLHLGDSHRPAGEVRLEEGIDQGDVAPSDFAIDFRRRAISNASRQLGIFQGDQLA